MTTTPLPSITDDVLAEIEAAAKAATPGQWKVKDGYYPGFKELEGASFSLSVVVSATDLKLSDFMARTSDLEHIALCNPANVLALIARIKELEKDAARMSFVEAHPGWLRHHKKHWQCVNPCTNYEYSVFTTARQAIDAAMQANT